MRAKGISVVESFLGAEPDPPLPGPGHRRDIFLQPMRIDKRGFPGERVVEFLAPGGKKTEAVFRGHPQHAGPVPDHAVDVAVGQTVGIIIIRDESVETPHFPVEADETGERIDPQDALACVRLLDHRTG